MQTDQLLPPLNRKKARLRAGRTNTFRTFEERSARKHHSFLPYFRLRDSLCCRFLELAADPCEFAGLKLLFPFVREMSVLRAPRGRESFSLWMHLAFLAGHDLGRKHPELAEEILPGAELREARRRVGVLRQCSGEEVLSLAGLKRACARIVEAQWSAVPAENVEAVLLEAVVKSLRTGFAAGTVCQGDPLLCEFVWDIPARSGQTFSDVVARSVIGAPLNSVNTPVTGRLEHPLLRLARELYPAQPLERDTVLDFIRGRLQALAVKSEDECASSELHLLDWIGAGIAYGRLVKEAQPGRVQRIFQEVQGPRLEASMAVVRRVVAEAGGTDPARLLPRLKAWQEEVYGWKEPGFYGEELARVAYFSDFAVWIPWVLPSTERTNQAGGH